MNWRVVVFGNGWGKGFNPLTVILAVVATAGAGFAGGAKTASWYEGSKLKKRIDYELRRRKR